MGMRFESESKDREQSLMRQRGLYIVKYPSSLPDLSRWPHRNQSRDRHENQTKLPDAQGFDGATQSPHSV